MSPSVLELHLLPHPASPRVSLDSVTVGLERDAGGLRLRYRYSGNSGLLRLPEPATPAMTHGLWRHTCCEAFVGGAGEAAYREFNFSPSGQWAAYAFRACRDRDEAATDRLAEAMKAALSPAIALNRVDGRIELDATIPVTALPRATALEIGLSTVLEDRDGGLTYWALRHPMAQPDFHHRDAFALILDATP